MAENKLFTTLLKKEVRDDDGEKSITIWANRSDVIDRSGHVIDDDAWQLDRFLSNPVICAFHRYDRPPVATAMWARVVPGKGLMMKIKFASTNEGQEFYKLYSENVLNAFSVGFLGKKYVDDTDMTKLELKKYERNGEVPNRVYKEVELFEVSCVAVPDNFASLVAKSANFKSEEVVSFIEEVKKSKEYIELISNEQEPTEEKAKKIGFIDLEVKTPSIDLSESNEINMDKYQEEVKKEQDEDTEEQKSCELVEDEECPGESCENYKECNKPNKKEIVGENNDKSVDENKGISDDIQDGSNNVSDSGDREVASIAKEEIIEVKEIENEDNKIKLLKFFAKDADKDIINKIDIFKFEEVKRLTQLVELVEIAQKAMDIVEKDNCSIKEAMIEVVGVSKEKEKEIVETVKNVFISDNSIREALTDSSETKEFIEIDQKEFEIDFDPQSVKDLLVKSIGDSYKEMNNFDSLIEERVKRYKGIIF